MNSNNPIDSLFKQELESHQMKASEKVWDKIAAAQPAPRKRVAPIFILRAATVALLIGLSSLVYFNSNSERLMNLRIEQDHESAAERLDEVNPNPEPKANALPITIASEPNEPKSSNTKEPKQEPKSSSKKSSKADKPKVIPALKTVNSRLYLAVNDDVAPGAEVLGMEEAEELLRKDQGRVKIKVQLPEVRAYYGPDTTQADDSEKSESLWAYATNQFDRIVAGERPSLPKTSSSISIPLPDFINRQFAKY